jgi:hypothetical protein
MIGPTGILNLTGDFRVSGAPVDHSSQHVTVGIPNGIECNLCYYHLVAFLSNRQPRGNQAQGAFVQYLKYALGEIVLVVIGILIALQINDWYQERLNRQSEHEYLLSMMRDLTEDARELRMAIDGNDSLLEGQNETLRLLAKPEESDAWKRDIYLHGLKYSYWYVVMEFSRLTMTQLQYSGDMQLITDAQVREAMVAYEQGLETAQQQSRDVMVYFHEMEESHKRLFNLTLSKQALEFIEQDYLNMLQPMDVFEPLVPQGDYFASDDPALIADYHDDMLYYRTALNILTLMHRRQLRLAESLSTLIEKQYGIENQVMKHEAVGSN